MNKSAFILIVLIVISSICQSQNKRPNVLLLISDQHSGRIMKQTGYPHIKTPGIDKLAAEGVCFIRSYCTYPVCVASRVAPGRRAR